MRCTKYGFAAAALLAVLSGCQSFHSPAGMPPGSARPAGPQAAAMPQPMVVPVQMLVDPTSPGVGEYYEYAPGNGMQPIPLTGPHANGGYPMYGPMNGHGYVEMGEPVGECPHCSGGPFRFRRMYGHGYGCRCGHCLHAGRNFVNYGPVGPPTGTVAYPYYSLRGPRDFLLDNPPSIGY